MTYCETAPPAGIGEWVASFWSFAVDDAAGEIAHTIPLTGGAMLSLSKGELYLIGPRTSPLVTTVRGGEVYRGVHLLPGATTSLFGVPGRQWREAQLPARFAIDPGFCDRLIGAYSTDEEFVRAATDALRDVAKNAAEADVAVARTVERILLSDGDESVAALAGAAGISPRQLRRRFSHHVGMSPKELARIVRLRAAAAAAVTRGDSWTDVVADHGFADQPHLVREFRSMLGVTPTRFGEHARRIAHTLRRETRER